MSSSRPGNLRLAASVIALIVAVLIVASWRLRSMELSLSREGGVGVTVDSDGLVAVRLKTCDVEVRRVKVHAFTTDPVFGGSNELSIEGSRLGKGEDVVVSTGLTADQLPSAIQFAVTAETKVGTFIDPVSFDRAGLLQIPPGSYALGDFVADPASSGTGSSLVSEARFASTYPCD